jgi:hypothetical protein
MHRYIALAIAAVAASALIAAGTGSAALDNPNQLNAANHLCQAQGGGFTAAGDVSEDVPRAVDFRWRPGGGSSHASVSSTSWCS